MVRYMQREEAGDERKCLCVRGGSMLTMLVPLGLGRLLHSPHSLHSPPRASTRSLDGTTNGQTRTTTQLVSCCAITFGKGNTSHCRKLQLLYQLP
jgi:hypothetical protein